MEAASCLQVSRKVATGGGTRAAISAMSPSSITPGPLGISETSPTADAPHSTTRRISSTLAMQQTLTRGRVVIVFERAASPFRRGELRDDLNRPDEVAVELRQVLGRNPVLLMEGAAHGPHLVSLEELGAHAEPRDDAAPVPAVPDVSVVRDLRGVLLVEHRV